MKTKTINIYSFSELSDEAKKTALSNYQNEPMDYFWADENRQSLELFAKEFPIKITNWSYGGRGEGVDYRFTTDYEEIEELSGIRLRTYILNNFYSLLYERKHYGEYSKNETTKKWSYKRYSKISFIETSCPLTGYCMDGSLLYELREFIKNPDNRTFEELLNDCFAMWVKDCNSDYEYQYSMEYYSEHCEANDYEFDEEGNII